ncbi:MAG: hypothetical protein V4456_12415 [Bacteroidota bacterium]
MKKLGLVVLLSLSVNILYSQNKAKASKSGGSDIFEFLENAKKDMGYTVKYDSNFKPYYECVLLNKSSKKTITTLIITCDYGVNGKYYYRTENLHKVIKPKSRGTFNIVFSDALLKNYHAPADFETKKIEISNIRYSDGSIEDTYIVFFER